jgi:hypothetical protein
MRLVLKGRQEEELADAVILPPGEELIQGSMKGLSLDSAGAGVTLLSRVHDPVVEARRQENSAIPGDLPGDRFHDERVGSEWEMGPVLDQGSNRKKQARISGQYPPDLRPGEVLEGQ